MSATDGKAPQSVIHDIGFRRYEGPRLGRGWAFRSLAIETLRGAYGIGRPARVKAMPWVLASLFTAPTLVMIAITILTGTTELPVSYTAYPMTLSLLVSFFIAGRAPYAVSRDIRDGVIPLYLSRPLTRRDYVLAKVTGVATATFLFLATPITLLLVGALLAKLPVGGELRGWLGGLLIAAVLSVLVSVVSLVIASFTKRRGLGIAAILAVLVLSTGFANILIQLVSLRSEESTASYLAMLDPYLLVDGLAAGWLGVDPYVAAAQPDGTVGTLLFTGVLLAVIGGGLALLLHRFKKVGGV